ncbi:MAG TPA: ABC transporter substrate-binding protein, partial [Pelagibacterium sp.]|nr:ABC transporter substrate-binding protein [Pelagibacterium sp.]
MLNRSAIAALAVSTALFATPVWAQAMPATVDQPVEITYYNYNLASTG